jgi:hypothetical protein
MYSLKPALEASTGLRHAQNASLASMTCTTALHTTKHNESPSSNSGGDVKPRQSSVIWGQHYTSVQVVHVAN